jgi:hypothetical protein
MCLGKGCKLKENCYRFKAKPDKYWQCYFSNPPIKNGLCDNYWEMKEEMKGKKK